MFSLKNKKIVVTGAHGFLGQHVVDNLLVKRKLKKSNIFLPASSQFDLRKWEDCEQVVMGKDLIINLAARVGGIGYNRSNPGSLFYDNLMIGAQMMEAARQAGVKKFISLGTVCAYPKVIPIPFREEDLWSGYPEETNAPYGLAKKMQLVQAQAYRNEYNFNVIYLLLVNLFGPGDDFDEQKSHVIPALIKKIHSAKKNRQDSIVVWGDGSATREFLFVKDAAEAVLIFFLV